MSAQIITIEDLENFKIELIGEINEIKKIIQKQGAKTNETVTANQACEMLSITLPTLWRWEKEKYLVPQRIGKKRIYLKSEVEKLLNNRTKQQN